MSINSVLCVFVISINILGILSFPTKDDWNNKYEKAKGRSWEYGTKINHPAPKHGYHHKGHDYHTNNIHHKDGGKGWTHTSDTGDKGHSGIGHYEKPHFPEIHHKTHHKIPDEISIHIPDVHIPEHIPIHIPPVHTIPIHIPEHIHEPKAHYEPKRHYEHHYPSHHYEEPKKEDHLDKLTDFNVDGIIDDIQKDLKKTTNYVS